MTGAAPETLRREKTIKKQIAESGTRTPTLPISGNIARSDPVEPPWLDSKLEGLITEYILRSRSRVPYVGGT